MSDSHIEKERANEDDLSTMWCGLIVLDAAEVNSPTYHLAPNAESATCIECRRRFREHYTLQAERFLQDAVGQLESLIGSYRGGIIMTSPPDEMRPLPKPFMGRIEQKKDGIVIELGSAKRVRSWRCAHCGQDTLDDFMLKNEVWEKIAKKNELLHLECVAKRLGRPLTLDDFTNCLANRLVKFVLGGQR